MTGFFHYVALIVFLSACGGGGGSNAPPPAPSATTMDANPISNDNAVLNGDVNPHGLATTARFEYGQNPTLSNPMRTDEQTIGSGTAILSVLAAIDNLTAGTTYYYRIVASNSAGTSFGAIDSFTAALLPPAVITKAAGPISNDNAVLNGDVNPKGLPTIAWFEWGTDPNLNSWSVAPDNGAINVGAGSASVTIEAPIGNLTPLIPGTTYYFRVAANNLAGAPEGTIESFKASQIPSAITNAATSVTSNSATLNGSVNPNGLQTNYWFVWGNDPNLTNPAMIDNTTPQGIASGTFTAQPVNAPLAGLSPATTYYFRVMASNVKGDSQGTIRNFITSLSPTVTTNAATFNSPTSAVLKGDANPNGYATTAWFEYGTDPTMMSYNITSPSQYLGSGSAAVPFSSAPITLNLYQTYYFRAVAQSSEGTEKDQNIRSFQTGVRYVAVGDSITKGAGDTIPSDGTGYEPILGNRKLNNLYTIANAGVSGTSSADGAASISSTLATYQTAKYYLIMYGTNDADNSGGPPVSANVYKTNMQAIITAIKNAGKVPYLAKVPYVDPTNPSFPAGVSFSDAAIQQYNQAIDELVADPLNNISVIPPDYYSWFLSNKGQLADGFHPNGTGYQSMATKWFEVLP
jgi:lysophospholipase L1-like esterase